jgi:hypothetical protein
MSLTRKPRRTAIQPDPSAGEWQAWELYTLDRNEPDDPEHRWEPEVFWEHEAAVQAFYAAKARMTETYGRPEAAGRFAEVFGPTEDYHSGLLLKLRKLKPAEARSYADDCAGQHAEWIADRQH